MSNIEINEVKLMVAYPEPAGNIHAPDLVETQSAVSFYENPIHDAIIDAMFQLSAEVWTARRRAAVLETLLVEKGIIEPEQIDTYVPTETETDALSAKRQDFVERVLQSFIDYSG